MSRFFPFGHRQSAIHAPRPVPRGPWIEEAALVGEGFSSLAEWSLGQTQQLRARWGFNALLRDSLGPQGGWMGFCNLCRKPVEFLVPSLRTGLEPELREEMICRSCGINARSRAGLMLALQSLDRASRIYITEQASKAFVWLQQQGGDVIGSEFEPQARSRARLADHMHRMGGHGDIHFEDVTKLTFADGSLDAVMSFDVLEHVPAYQDALKQFARVLRPGGVLVVTVPFRPDCPDTVVRAHIGGDGAVVHLLEPEFHGDPLGAGVLCFYHFGWDLVAQVRQAGFASARMVVPWAPSMGMFSGLWTLVAYR